MNRALADHNERRENDRGFFVWARIGEALCCDPTRILEFWTGLLGFGIVGLVLVTGIADFPPQDVRFLLRQIPLLTPDRMGWVLLATGIAQALAIATKSHNLRGWIAVVAAIEVGCITLAYVLADLATYYLAWVAFLTTTLIETWLLYRNFKDGKREEKVRHFVMRRHGLTDDELG